MPDDCSICGKTKEMHGTFSDHKYECNMSEAFAISGGLSSQAVGGKKIEEMESCSCFDSVHEALLHETGYLPDDPDKSFPFKELDEGGPGSGPQQGERNLRISKYPDLRTLKPKRIVGYQGENNDIPIYDYGNPKHSEKEAYDKWITDPKTGKRGRVISDPGGLY